MKVMCIDGSTDHDSPLPVDIIEGHIYTVVRDVFKDGKKWYVLAEMLPFDIYTAKDFIPLSSIDETTFERNYNTKTA